MLNVANPASGGALCKPLTISRVYTQGDRGWTPTKKLLLVMRSIRQLRRDPIAPAVKTIVLAMKLTALIILIACLAASANGHSQGITLSGKNISLEKVFTEIRKQSGLNIVYTKQMLEGAKKVDIQLQNVSLQKALDECLRGQPLTYTIVNNTIVIKPKENVEETKAQENPVPPIDIKGRITNEDGEPVSASITVKGTQQGTTSNADGYFELKGVDENATLVITGISIERLELKVNGKKDFDLTAKRKVTSLNEVVIGKGYYEEKQKFSVGNAVRITAKEIEKQPVQNPLFALQGRVPGLEITQLSGVNGGGVSIRIQGENSLALGGSPPLIIVDGIPYPTEMDNTSSNDIIGKGSPLNYINPLDIESIDVLKDADATSIYGSRAANGAIVITTKKGKPGKIRVGVRLQQGWGKVPNRLDMLNTRQYLDMRYEAYRNDGIDWRASNVSANDLKLWDTTRYTDWQKLLIGGTAKYANASASISGGTTAATYMVGLGFNRRTTVFPGDFDDVSGNLHFNLLTSSANQRLQFQLGGSYNIGSNNLPNNDLTGTAVKLEPVAPSLYNTDGSFNWAPNAAGNSTWENPVIFQTYRDYTLKTNNIIANSMLSYKLVSGLEIKATLGYNRLQSDSYKPFPMSAERPEDQPTFQRIAVFGSTKAFSWIAEPMIYYTTTLGKGNLTSFIGGSIQQRGGEFLTVQGQGYSSDQLLKTLSAASSVSASSGNSEYKYAAIFGRLGYIWDEKYIISLTVRRDGSSRFGDKNKFHSFASAGVGWIFTGEKMIQKTLPFLSFGKLHATYGASGSDNINDYAYMSLYRPGSSSLILYQGQVGMSVSRISNPYLQWQETSKLMVGMSLGFFKDRLMLNANWSRNRSSNQLIGYVLPGVTGFNSIERNFPATVQNANWEFTVNSINVKTRDFEWRTGFNFTTGRNKLLAFPDLEQSSYAGSLTVGQPIGYSPVYKFAGIDAATGIGFAFDENGYPVRTPSISKSHVKVSTLPDFYGGIDNSITYKGFQLDFHFRFVRQKGRRFLFNGEILPGLFNYGKSNQPVSVMERWQRPGDITAIPRFITSGNNGRLYGSDAYYSYDASFIRLNNLSLSWNVPAKVTRILKLRNVRVFSQMQNLFTISRYEGLDPETQNISSLPPLRMITTGINIEF